MVTFDPGRHRVTREDAVILQRQMFRVLRWCRHRPSGITRTLKNACGDYLHPNPELPNPGGMK